MSERVSVAKKCSRCSRGYTDSRFNLDEFTRSNMAGIKFGANRRGQPLQEAIDEARERHAAWLLSKGYENCTTTGCKMAIRPAPQGVTQ